MSNVSGTNNNVFALNYKALQLEETGKTGRSNQLGSEESVKKENTHDLKDGLSVDELKEIDKNDDGVITEEEFKNSLGDDYKPCWNKYTSFYNATQEKNENGNNVITQNLQDGRVVKTVMNGDKVVSTEFVELDGIKINRSYAADGTSVVSETKTKRNGTAQKTDYDKSGVPEKVTTTTSDGTVTVFDGSGRLSSITIKGLYHNVDENKKVSGNDKETTISFDYANKTAKIGDKVYSNFSVDKDGKVTIKSDDGSRDIMTVSKNDKGETNIWMDIDGKNKKTIGIDKEGAADSIYEYYEDGHYKKHIWCGSGAYREFTWEADDYCKETNDYTKDGIRTSKQTYYHGDKVYDNNWMLWDSITYYNDKGEETSFREISYDKAEDGSVVNTTKYFDKKGGTLKSESVNEQDHFGNTLKYIETNYETGVVKTTQNVWDDACFDTDGNLKELFDGSKIKETVTTVGTQVITRSYSNGSVMKERLSDSANKDNNYTSTFTWNGSVKASELKKFDGGKSILDNYDALGRMLSRIERDKNNMETLRTLFEKGEEVKTVKTTYEELNYQDKSSVEVFDGKQNFVRGQYKLDAILKKIYPDMDNVCRTQLKSKIEKLNNFGPNALVDYNDSSSPEFKIPEFDTDGRIIVFK